MSQISKGIFGAFAIALTFGAVQLASGHDLLGGQSGVRSTILGTSINRVGKADRASVPVATGQTRTIALQVNNLPDTSVLVRVPVAKELEKEARNELRNRPAVPPVKPAARKATVACEPPVSVLTEVAKLLQPGRCVT